VSLTGLKNILNYGSKHIIFIYVLFVREVYTHTIVFVFFEEFEENIKVMDLGIKHSEEPIVQLFQSRLHSNKESF
jgi:hypothetical protein